MFRDLDLHPVYDSSEHDIIQDLIIPLLSESVEYWRGVGFFTSGWIRTACKGIIELVHNQGKAHIVTSPIMQKRDWEALKVGSTAKQDEVLKDILQKHVSEFSKALSKDTLNALAWMVSDGLFEFRFAIPREFGMGGDYHDKVGIFIDAKRDVVAIHGSFNDSEKGSLNGEAFSVFKSWEDGQFPFVEQHHNRLLKLWQSGNSQFKILQLPEAIRQEIVRFRTEMRPYPLERDKQEAYCRSTGSREIEIKLRPYQNEAIDCWKQNGFKGIFEMATGTGKTYTALAAAADRRKAQSCVAVLILVPYLHLLEQWRQNSEIFDFLPILCSGNHDQWPKEIRSKCQDFRLGGLQSLCIIAVHSTAATEKFAKAVQSIPPESMLLIADEVHALGAPKLRDALLSCAGMRLGLSATPRRWYDDEGTQFLLSYFNGVCYEFTLEQAIGNFLTPYRYIPIPTHLTADENQEYEYLSNRIAVLTGRDLDKDNESREYLKKLLLKRAQIISKAKNKLTLLLNAIQKQIEQCKIAGKELRDVLIYCAPGNHKEVLLAVSTMGLRCHEFVHTVSMHKREKVLKQFSRGDIQVLIAIHCLDEGVDVPSTKTAYFLASTTNPKEFIQRRGRILRKYKGKLHADVYDFIIIPDIRYSHLRRETDLSLLRREMPRFAEFSDAAVNEFEARSTIREIVNAFEMLHLFDLKPWDIYHEVMESVEIKDRS